MAAIIPRPARPTPASAPPRAPLGRIADARVAGLVPPDEGPPPPAAGLPGDPGVNVVEPGVELPGSPGVELPGDPLPTNPRLNGLAGISPLPACTPPKSMLNEPAPVAEPNAMSKMVISVFSEHFALSSASNAGSRTGCTPLMTAPVIESRVEF